MLGQPSSCQRELPAEVRHLSWHSPGNSCTGEHGGVIAKGSPLMRACTVAGELLLLDSGLCHLAAVEIHRVAAEDPQIWCNLLRDMLGLFRKGVPCYSCSQCWLQRPSSAARRTFRTDLQHGAYIGAQDCASAHLQLSQSILDDMVSHVSHQI